MATRNPLNPGAAEDTSQPVTTLEPEVAVERLRIFREQIGEVLPLTAAERKLVRRRAHASAAALQAAINMMDSHDQVAQAVAQPADGLRRLCEEADRWTAVEDELRTLLKGVAGANLVRRERIALIAGQAYNIGVQLARNPANAVLRPQVEEIRRLKRVVRRKKPAPPSETSGNSKP